MPAGEIRRKDRIFENEDEIRDVIRKSASGIFGFVNHDQPYMNPNLFIYSGEENCIYFHTAGASTVKEIIQSNNQACFLIYDMGRFLPGAKATDLSVEYTSIMVFGKINIVMDQEKIMTIFQSYVTKYFPDLSPDSFQPFTIADAMKATMYRLSIGSITAKQNKKPEDFPGALYYSPKTEM
jgi:nitroimidazol reductase NimA-like FMN-containing flavoprotein (pyridoxamine 5'-phosphate oxidase superfamily)